MFVQVVIVDKMFVYFILSDGVFHPVLDRFRWVLTLSVKSISMGESLFVDRGKHCRY